jgi:hypothetical protein
MVRARLWVAIGGAVVLAMLLVPALGWTLLALAVWGVQGIGVVQWLLGEHASPSTLVRWILAIWAGLVLQIVVLANLYYAIPGLTIDQLAWPVTLVLAALSLMLVARTRRAAAEAEPNRDAWVVIGLTLLATALILRPLLGHHALGFYSSDNGEFANYAVMADIVRYHDASTRTGGLPTVSREGVTGIVTAVMCVLTSKSALWVIQPVAAAFAALAFASFGALCRAIGSKLAAGGRAILWAFFACTILSASSQCFFTLSFVSQYLNLALFFGGIVFLAHTRELPVSRRVAALAALSAALVAAYPEMFIPNVALLCAFELGAAERPWLRTGARALARTGAAIALGLVVINRLGIALLVDRAGTPAGGWDIYGPHRPMLPFVGRLAGFTNTFAPPHAGSRFWPALLAALIALGLAHAIVRFRRETDPVVRGLYLVGAVFFVGIAGVFELMAYRHVKSNYMALKFLLGYGWLALLLVQILFARAIEWKRAMLVPIAIAVALLAIGLAAPALEYTKKLHRAEKGSLYLENDPCAATLRGRIYVSATRPGNDAIVGRFIAYEHDLLAIEGGWPDGKAQAWLPGEPVLLLGDSALAADTQVLLPYRSRCEGRGVRVLDP